MISSGPESTHDLAAQKRWNFPHLAVAWVVGVFFQMMMLPCLCSIGTWRMDVGLSFDLMVLLRMVVAYFRPTTGYAWVFYAVLCYTSGFWLYWLTSMILRFSEVSDC